MFSFLDVHNIDLEEKTGLYTFYYRPVIENFDLYLDDNNIGAGKLIDIINERFILPMCNKKVDVKLSLDFEQSLGGDINSNYKSIEEKKFNSKLFENRFYAKQEFKNPVMRSAIKSFMENISFNFNKPIYIGVSHNIKERLLEHYDDYFHAKSMINESAEVAEDNFGSRAATFAKESELYFTVQYIDSETLKLSKENSYKMALMMEWVLNQQNTPILGRK